MFRLRQYQLAKVGSMLLTSMLYFFGASCAMSQNIQTPSLSIFAGSMSGQGNADGPSAIASFRFPSGVAVDAHGNIYVADIGRDEDLNNTIRKISPSGMVTTFAGKAGERGNANGNRNEARFLRPQSVATDTQGNVYVADSGNHLVRKITPEGIVSTLAGSGKYGNEDGIGTKASFFLPGSLAVDVNGNVYVESSYRIRKISPAGVVSTLAGGEQDYPGKDGKGSEATFSSINQIAVDRQSNVYITDFTSVRKINPDGVVTTIAGNADTDGGEGCEPLQAQFQSVSGITIDADGNIFVLDNQSIRKISSDGKVTTLAGLAGAKGHVDGMGKAARFNSLHAELSNDVAGNIYLADSENHVIRKITSEGEVSTVAGRSIIGEAMDEELYLNEHSRLAIDGEGSVYVSGRLTIYKITQDRILTKRKFDLLAQGIRHIGAMVAGTNGDLYFLNEGISLGVDSGAGGGYSLLPKSVLSFFALFESSRFNSIHTLSADGKLKKVAGKSARVSVGGIVTNNSGDIIFSSYDDTLKKLKTRPMLPPKVMYFAGKTKDSDIQNAAQVLGSVSSLAIDAEDNIYVSDISGGVIRKISPAGEVNVLAGSGQAASINGKGKLASFNRPFGIAVDKKGNVYTLELNSDVVRKVSANGEVTTFVGTGGVQGFSGGPLPGVISRPLALAVHGTSLYILMADGMIAVVKNLP